MTNFDILNEREQKLLERVASANVDTMKTYVSLPMPQLKLIVIAQHSSEDTQESDDELSRAVFETAIDGGVEKENLKYFLLRLREEYEAENGFGSFNAYIQSLENETVEAMTKREC